MEIQTVNAGSLKIDTATTERLVARYQQIIRDANILEATGTPAMARGFRRYGKRIAVELSRRGIQVQ